MRAHRQIWLVGLYEKARAIVGYLSFKIDQERLCKKSLSGTVKEMLLFTQMALDHI
jgi:hypothetical protein